MSQAARLPGSRAGAQAAAASESGTEMATHRDLSVNGLSLHVAEEGTGPLVLLCHGWPELGHSWRRQLPALAEAGYRAVAPDMRGFGRSDAPEAIEAYSLPHLVGDMVGLVGALGEREAVIVGHDWGAPVAWTAALLRPDLFRAVVGMSVPHRARGPAPPLHMLQAAGMRNFYWQYFQEPGVAEAEFERDVDDTLRRILGATGFGARRGDPAAMLTVPEGGGFLDLVRRPERLPPWLAEEDLAVMVAEYRRTGFRGGLNYYRNLDRNWALLAPWQDVPIRQPALFVAGASDAVILGFGRQALHALPDSVPGLRRSLLIEGAGHWIQQEQAEEVNAALVRFLDGLP